MRRFKICSAPRRRRRKVTSYNHICGDMRRAHTHICEPAMHPSTRVVHTHMATSCIIFSHLAATAAGLGLNYGLILRERFSAEFLLFFAIRFFCCWLRLTIEMPLRKTRSSHVCVSVFVLMIYISEIAYEKRIPFGFV